MITTCDERGRTAWLLLGLLVCATMLLPRAAGGATSPLPPPAQRRHRRDGAVSANRADSSAWLYLALAEIDVR